MSHRLVLAGFVILVLATNSSWVRVVEKPSPMAKLMRQMLTYLKEERLQIEKNGEPLSFPTDIVKMNKARITPGKKLALNHNQYTNKFFEQLEKYYQTKDVEARKASFNLLIQTCITCHEEECPGPIEAIKRNLIK